MESIEISGKTVEDAIQRAVQKLGIARDMLKYTVIKEGKPGILGIGSEEARILVESSETTIEAGSENDATGRAQEILEELLKYMGFKAEVKREKPLADENNGNPPAITFNITGDDDVGILIGRHGQTMSTLQYLLRIMIARQIQSPPSVTIDVDGYKQRRYESLKATAVRLAEQVKTRKTPFTLEPMPPFERRIIHVALADDPNVTTQSVGEGENRKVVIMPKSMGKGTRTIINK